MLTKKGSTRGTVSVLFLSAFIFLGARFAVAAIEAAMPIKPEKTIAWKPIPDVLKNSKSNLVVSSPEGGSEIEDKSRTSDTDDQNDVVGRNKSGDAAEDEEVGADSNSVSLDTNSDAKSDKNSDSDPHKRLNTPVPSSKTSSAPSKDKNRLSASSKVVKRFAIEKVFTDNVDQRPIMLFFTDERSVISKKMENASLSAKDVREKIEKDFYPVKINYDKKLTKTEYRLYKEYGSTAVPIMHIVSSTGESLGWTSGYISAVKVMVLMRNAKAKLIAKQQSAD